VRILLHGIFCDCFHYLPLTIQYTIYEYKYLYPIRSEELACQPARVMSLEWAGGRVSGLSSTLEAA
jgi:hypothetical protein